jgi:cytochrome P450
MNAGISRLDEIVYGIIEQRKKQPTDKTDLLALLLTASDGADGGWTDRELRDEVVTLLLAVMRRPL